MVYIPKKVSDRLIKHVRKFQRILKVAKDRDVSEADTVTIISDILSDVFGYDKYTEITSEQAIRGTYCDLAIKVGESIDYLIEVKAIGKNLKENHLRQAQGYGMNQGLSWVILTNGIDWEIYHLKYDKPISSELVCSFNWLELNPRKQEDQEKLFLLCKEGLKKAAIEHFHDYVQVVNRFVIGAILQTPSSLDLIRRELRRVSPRVKVRNEEIEQILLSEVMKRDIVEGEEADGARSLVKKASSKKLRKNQSTQQ